MLYFKYVKAIICLIVINLSIPGDGGKSNRQTISKTSDFGEISMC